MMMMMMMMMMLMLMICKLAMSFCKKQMGVVGWVIFFLCVCVFVMQEKS